MRFDPHAFLKNRGGGNKPPPDPAPPVAPVAHVARPHPSNPAGRDQAKAPAPDASLNASPAVVAAAASSVRTQSDADAYLAALSLYGPMTYGAAEMALRWGATQAWLAEAALVADGRANLTRWGQAMPNTT